MTREYLNGIEIPYGAPVERLRQMALADRPERWAAFAALAAASDPRSLDVLVEACGSADEHMRRAGVEGIGRHSVGRTSAEVVLRLLDDPSQLVARSACIAAAELGIVEARDALHRLRLSSDPATREEALRALSALWRADDFDALLAQSREDSSVRVRREAAWTLKSNAGADHAARLFAEWRRAPLPRHRLWACELAAAHPTRSFGDELLGLTHDPDGHVRKAAGRALDVLNNALREKE